MKQLIVAALLATAVLAERDYDAMFKEFKATHLKAYANAAEESQRKQIFVENMKKAEVFQAANPLATFGPNEFADMSAAEFKSRHNAERHYKKAMSLPRNEVTPSFEQQRAAAGQKIDWRTKGAVTPVKNQGQCGSCWSFSTTGNIEGQWFLAGNTLTSVSEQELVSCDTIDSGCDGGLMDNAFTWLLQNRGGSIVTEASLPYNSGSGQAPSCPSNLASLPVGATIYGYNDITKTEDAMAAWCYQSGPVAIALDATSFQTYSSGILTNCISQQIDHGVLIVGFDDTNVPPYWIIKNSWGPSWGENGYIRVAKGSNQCLITSYPTSSHAKKGGPTQPPSPTVAPTTTAPSGNGTFVQMVCNDAACSQGCNKNSFPLNTCLPLNGGGSAIATCAPGSVTLTEYFSTDCSGASIPDQMPTNQCLQDTDGTYLENICSSAVEVNARRFNARKQKK